MALLVLLLLAVSLVTVAASDPPPPSDIKPNLIYRNAAESNSTRFRRNVHRAYKYLFNTVPTKGATQHTVGSGSNTVHSYGQCYNITRQSCSSCLNVTAANMGNHWLGARLYLKQNDTGCFIRYENYAFSTDPPPPSDIKPNLVYRNAAESNSTRFRRNVHRAYKYLFNTVPTKGATHHTVGRGSNTVHSYGQCYNITRQTCSSCLNVTAANMGNHWLGARLYLKQNDTGCFIRYENYAFSTEASQPAPSTAPILPPVALPAPGLNVPPSGDSSVLPPSPQHSGVLDPARRDTLITVVVGTAILTVL